MYYKKIAKLLKRGFGSYKKQLALLVTLGTISGFVEGIGISALIPLFARLSGGPAADDKLSQVIGTILGWFNQGFGLKALLTFLVLTFILKSVIVIASQYISILVVSDFQLKTRNLLFKKTMYANWPYLLSQKIGHLQTILANDIGMSSALFTYLGTVMVSTTNLIAYTALAVTISPAITFISLAIGATIFFILKPIFYKIRELSKELADANSEVAHFVNENILGFKTVKASAVEKPVIQSGEKFFLFLRNLALKVKFLQVFSGAILEPISIIFISAVFATTYLMGNLEIGAFAATMYLIHRIFQRLQSVQIILSSINERVPYLQRIIDFQDSVDSAKEAAPAHALNFSFNETLEFRDVNFTYANKDKKTLSNLSFKVRRGEMLGIIGESGAGKTTIFDLLLRLFMPKQGSINVDGVDISKIKLDEWRKNIGYVLQDTFVMHDTIQNNIRFYEEKISQQDIEQAAKMAYFYDFVSKQPKQWNSVVGERGVLLSGGERQRLVLARALARKPSILILDEATSALDNHSEQMIQKAIDGLKGKITILVIAHRLSTLLNCDQVIFLANGKIKERGTPKELLASKDSHFYKLYNINR